MKKDKILFKISIISIIMMLIITNSYAQYQDKFWIFGDPEPGNSPVNFTIYDNFNSPLGLAGPNVISGFPSSSTGSGPGQSFDQFGAEGSAVATDPSTGNLMFYTDGERLWDSNHLLKMSNLGGHSSSTQPAAICVVPVCPFDSFYVFSNPTAQTGVGNNFGVITYRKYDKISGSFSAPSALPFPGSISNTIANEGMIIIPSRQDTLVYFLISRLFNPTTDNWFVVHKIDSNGVTYVNKYNLGPSANSDYFGNFTYSSKRYPSFTSNYVELAVASSANIYTLRFNTATGILDNYTSISTNPDGDNFYDVEYSPNGNYLYYSTYYLQVNLYQYDFSTGLHTMNTFFNRGGGGLKRASDGYIYHLTKGVTNNITEVGRILTPNSPMISGNLTGFYEMNVLTIYNINVALNFPEFITIPTNGDLPFCGTTSVRNIYKEESNLNIYPIPSSSIVYIDVEDFNPKEIIQLLDVTGKIVEDYNYTIMNHRVELDIHNVPKGVYFVTLTDYDSGLNHVGKIVKIDN